MSHEKKSKIINYYLEFANVFFASLYLLCIGCRIMSPPTKPEIQVINERER